MEISYITVTVPVQSTKKVKTHRILQGVLTGVLLIAMSATFALGVAYNLLYPEQRAEVVSSIMKGGE